jgi:hypothetical protein
MAYFVELSNQLFKLVLNVKDLDKMLETRILSKSDSLELIEGEVFKRKETVTDELLKAEQLALNLKKHFGRKAVIKVQPSVYLHELQMLKPSVAVIKPSSAKKKRFYKDDLLFAIEFSDCRFNYSDNKRAKYYGMFEVQEVWFLIHNLGFIEVCTNPNYGYSRCRTYTKKGLIKSETIPDLEIEVDKLLG